MTDKDPILDSMQIGLKCQSLGFPVTYSRSESGPRVRTHYFKQPFNQSAPLSKVINKQEDIAFACGVDSVMIRREKDEIAFAIPLQEPELIKFDNALYWLATNAATHKMHLPLLMGQTPTGQWLSVDLATQPHMLIGGSTGAGKSVFLEMLIAALAVLKTPAELEMILVDTKRLDLTLFRGLQHVSEVVTEVSRLHDLLDSLIGLVRQRTTEMEGIARNIREFTHTKMDYKLLIIDELADVLEQDKQIYGTTSKQRDDRPTIESKLKTLTQISRAAGVHVIAATQRPSVGVLKGDIKVNFPMRLSFKLPTGVDSITVLGEAGAENLLGNGDYLYQTNENADVKRAHGAFVEQRDIARICIQHADIRQSLQALQPIE